MDRRMLDWLLEDDILEVRFGLQPQKTGSIQSGDDAGGADEPLLLEDEASDASTAPRPEAPSIASIQKQQHGGPARGILIALIVLIVVATGVLLAPIPLPGPIGELATQVRTSVGIGNQPEQPKPPVPAAVPIPPSPPTVTAPATSTTELTAPEASTGSAPATAPETGTAPTAGTSTETAPEPASTSATAETPAPTPKAVWYVHAGPFERDAPPTIVSDAGYGWNTTSDTIEQAGRQVATSPIPEDKARALLDALKKAGINARLRTSATGISVIAGPFTERADADAAAIEMAKLGAPASASDVKKRIRRYWARIGPVEDAASAAGLAEQLKTEVATVRIEEALETP